MFCPRNHDPAVGRNTQNRCRGCAREDAAKWRAEHLEQARHSGREYQRRKDPAVRRADQRRRAGVLDATGEMRSGPCPICLRDRALVCDHWHDGPKKGRIRGWICDSCNVGLGRFRDDAAALKRASEYVENL